jgi:trehalose-6-phosphate synthase
MKAMRKTVRGHDVGDWAEEFMGMLKQVRPDHRKRLRPSKLLS